MKPFAYKVQLVHQSFDVLLRIEFFEVFNIPRIPHFGSIHLGKSVGSWPGNFCNDEWSFPWGDSLCRPSTISTRRTRNFPKFQLWAASRIRLPPNTLQRCPCLLYFWSLSPFHVAASRFPSQFAIADGVPCSEPSIGWLRDGPSWCSRKLPALKPHIFLTPSSCPNLRSENPEGKSGPKIPWIRATGWVTWFLATVCFFVAGVLFVPDALDSPSGVGSITSAKLAHVLSFATF
jgi:hypothetical protein